jgi:hypothetical protein
MEEGSEMRRVIRGSSILGFVLVLCLAVGIVENGPVAAPAPQIVRGVRLLGGDVDPLLVGILGQLTLGGEPIPGTMFALLSHEKQIEDVRRFIDPALVERIRSERGEIIRQAIEEGLFVDLDLDEQETGVLADGVELVFIRGSRRIAVIQIQPGELRLGEPIILLESGIVKPLPTPLGPKNPGEAAVAFF